MLTEDNWFYDSGPFPEDDPTSLLVVERVYRLAWDMFTDADWDKLGAIYEQLPQFLGSGVVDLCPYWFSRDNEPGPFLCASVEPPGLQVAGELSLGAWEEWDRLFRQMAVGLPRREVGT